MAGQSQIAQAQAKNDADLGKGIGQMLGGLPMFNF
jgi:hypothetical protein